MNSAPRFRGRVGRVVALSVVAGLVTAIVFAAVVFAGAQEHVITGTVMLAFALGWALLAVCSRWTDQPQPWAVAPAAFMGVVGAGLLIVAPGADTIEALGWAWPPLLLALVVWMTLQARRQLRSRTRRWLLYPVFGFLALASIGGTYEAVGESLHRQALPAGGQLVDIGGYRLYLHCTGSGSPAVVLEAGLGETSVSWQRIAPAVARQTRVCTYDRAGRGWSENASGSQNGLQTAAALHTLLIRADVPGPYVLVGHSLGGIYTLTFADQFPAQVAGLVLVDSMSPDQFTRLPDYAGIYDGLHRASGPLASLARLGVGRLAGSDYGARAARGFRDDVDEIPTSLKQAQSLRSIGAKPLIVLTAGRDQEVGWSAAQDDLATLSTNSLHRLAARATHASLLEEDADAERSSKAIRDLVRAVRARVPLTQP